MNSTYSSLQTLAVRLQLCPGVGPAALRELLGRIGESGLTVEEWLALDDRTLQTRYGLRTSSLQAMRNDAKDAQEILHRLQAMGVNILVWQDEIYPKRLEDMLGRSAPPLLYAVGNLDLFRLPSVGFCGSRKASDKGLKATCECAQILAHEEVNVVSGYASGVDLAAHEAALSAGGTTTAVLAEGILHFRVKQALQLHLGNSPTNRFLVVSEFPPGLPWKAHNAMTRNRTICGLSNALIVIESGLEGGTFEAGKTALQLGEPLFCVEYGEPAPSAAGNPYFLSHGARSLRRSKSGTPNLSHVLDSARSASVHAGKNALPLLREDDN